MLVTAFFKWWYGQGWAIVWHRSVARLRHVGQVFSVQLLLRTLFAPWRRISTSGRSLDGKIQAAISNGVGRLVGFIVRLAVLLTALFVFVAFVIFGVCSVVLWPLIPPAAVIAGIGGIII